MNSARNVLSLARVCTRQFNQSAVRRVQEVPSAQFKKLKEKQKRFQVDDGLPVYLKGGLMDKMCFQLTVVVTTIGMIMGIQTFVSLAQK